MTTNIIRIENTIYEIYREHTGDKTAVNLVRDKLLEARSQNSPLTQKPTSVYNNNRGVGMPNLQKEER